MSINVELELSAGLSSVESTEGQESQSSSSTLIDRIAECYRVANLWIRIDRLCYRFPDQQIRWDMTEPEVDAVEQKISAFRAEMVARGAKNPDG